MNTQESSAWLFQNGVNLMLGVILLMLAGLIIIQVKLAKSTKGLQKCLALMPTYFITGCITLGVSRNLLGLSGLNLWPMALALALVPCFIYALIFLGAIKYNKRAKKNNQKSNK